MADSPKPSLKRVRFFFPLGGVLILFFAAALMILFRMFVGGAALSAGLFILLMGGLIVQGLVRVPVVHIAVLTIFGKRRESFVLDEGWHFLPLYPFVYGLVLVNVTKQNDDFTIKNIRTPDRAEIEVPIAVTFTPDEQNVIEYLNSGGDEGVRDILEDIVTERTREWASSGTEGPQRWEDAVKSDDEAVGIIVRAVLGEELTRILHKEKHNVPTRILRKYFANPQKPPTEEEWGEWGVREREVEEEVEVDTPEGKKTERVKKKVLLKPNWGNVEAALAKLSPDQLDDVKKGIEARNNEIELIRRGNGTQRHVGLGVILNRLNVGEIKVVGEVEKEAEQQARERQQKLGEETEISSRIARTKEIQAGTGMSAEKAFTATQIEARKITKSVQEVEIGPGAQQAISTIASVITAAFTAKPPTPKETPEEKGAVEDPNHGKDW